MLVVRGTTGSGVVTIYNGATLEGNGTVQGATTIQSGGTLLVGTNTATGVLSVSNTLTLSAGATNFMRISKTGGLAASDLLQGMSFVVSYGGIPGGVKRDHRCHRTGCRRYVSAYQFRQLWRRV